MIDLTITLHEPLASEYFDRSRESGKPISDLINGDLMAYRDYCLYLDKRSEG